MHCGAARRKTTAAMRMLEEPWEPHGLDGFVGLSLQAFPAKPLLPPIEWALRRRLKQGTDQISQCRGCSADKIWLKDRYKCVIFDQQYLDSSRELIAETRRKAEPDDQKARGV
jgi:hypothetical protein